MSLLELTLNGRSHPVEALPVHLSGQNLVTFTENNEVQAIQNRKACTTKLTAWFALNRNDPEARQYTYPEIPTHYVWDEGLKQWKKRAKATKMLSRLIAVSPKDFERFCLKILLRKTPGAQTYEELRTFEGCVYDTFGEVTYKRMLLSVENEELDIMEDAASFMMPKQLREFFISLILTSSSANAGLLYEKFKDALGDGLTREECLNEFENILLHENMSCLKIGLPSPVNFTLIKPGDRIPYSEHQKIFTEKLGSMNDEQRDILESIIAEVESGKQVLSFIDGPGGTGKTYLYNTLYHKLRSMKKTVVLLAWTGIASILLPNGKTLHNMFKLPLDVASTTVLRWSKPVKELIRDVDFFIFDEASMITVNAMIAIDNALKDLYSTPTIFGRKSMLFGGDFRQVLPVVKKGSRMQIIAACIKSATFWSELKQYRLMKNMRSTDGDSYAQWLLQVGNGEDSKLHVESSFLSEDLVEDIYMEDGVMCSNFMNRIILSPKNVNVSHINEKVLDRFHGDKIVCEGVSVARLPGGEDERDGDEDAMLRYPPEYLEGLTPQGLPPHTINVKVGCMVMLLRNICVRDGLCNGTRLKFLQLSTSKKIMICERLGLRRELVYIPRIKLSTLPNDGLPFILTRTQFPLKLCFAMSINKSQGQSFDSVGLYLPENSRIFGHGQLYVALSRCRRRDGIKVDIATKKKLIDNIVYREVL